MSARLDYINARPCIVWIVFEGDRTMLEANLRCYGVEYAPDFHHNRVGILCRWPHEYIKEGDFIVSAALEVVSLLSEKRLVTKREQESFIGSLAILQEHQHEREEAATC